MSHYIYQTIVVEPAEEHTFGFNIKYDEDRVSVPGFGCDFEQFEVELPPVLEEFGCSSQQIVVILRLMKENQSDVVIVEQDGKVTQVEDEVDDPEYDPEDDVDGDEPWN